MKDDHCAQVDAARFWIEAAHRLDLDDPERQLTDLELNQLFGGQPDTDVLPRHARPKGHRLIQFLYLRDLDFAGFVQAWIDRELTTEGKNVAAQLAAAWPGMAGFIEEAKSVEEDYRKTPHYQRMVDLIRNWDDQASHEDNIARHHLRMSAPKARQ